MNRRSYGARTFATIVLAMAASTLLVAQSSNGLNGYKLVDLGTLGGPNSYLPALPPYHGFVPSASLSASGTFAGYADTSMPDPHAPLCFNEDCFVSHAVAWKNGTLVDLGALPGAGGSSSAATWISKNGLIVGLSENGHIDPLIGFPSVSAVLWNGRKPVSLGTVDGGYDSQATAVNSIGQVVGLSSNRVPDLNSLWGTTTQTRAFLWQGGEIRDMGTLEGGTDAMALFINDSGQVVGQSYSANSIVPPATGCSDSPLTLYTFFWEKGEMRDIGTLGGHCAFPYALNNRGQVVGQANLAGDTQSHPFLWEPGKKMKDLGALGGDYGYAAWLNDAGSVVGTAANTGGALLAALWQEGTTTDLGTLPGDACSAADAINSAGQIVGGSGFYDAPYFPACTDLIEHAVLWDHGQIIDLNSLVPPGADLTLTEAWFINDRGEIGGIASLANGDQHVFLLVPCDQQNSPVSCQADFAESKLPSSLASSSPALQVVPRVRQLNGLNRSEIVNGRRLYPFGKRTK